ncbi:MAG TPA: hypothetical protein VFV39_02525 [Limnobacter sp.]|nr:hypothetical protein [Limnobacter sp.]
MQSNMVGAIPAEFCILANRVHSWWGWFVGRRLAMLRCVGLSTEEEPLVFSPRLYLESASSLGQQHHSPLVQVVFRRAYLCPWGTLLDIAPKYPCTQADKITGWWFVRSSETGHSPLRLLLDWLDYRSRSLGHPGLREVWRVNVLR